MLYAHANRVLHLETNSTPVPWCRSTAKWMFGFNPPPIPMSTEEMDYVFGMPYARVQPRLPARRRFPPTR